MPQISFSGAYDASTLSTPDVYINVEEPGQGIIRPATFGLIGVIGVASWGPRDIATPVGSPAQLALFGAGPVVRANDLLTCATFISAIQQAIGTGTELDMVRVTDGTDTAASVEIKDGAAVAGLTLTSKYTGIAPNGAATGTVQAGSLAGTWRLILQMPGFAPEIFNNIGLNLTGAALWQAMVNAVNNGIPGFQGPSQLMVASIGTSTAAPVAGAGTLIGGTDGATTITSSVLIGVDTAGARTGIYALRGSGCSDAVIADFCDITQETTLWTFGESEGIYMHTAGEPSETATDGATNKATSGTDNPWIKRWLGDWVYWPDNYNGVTRLLAPSTPGAGLVGSLQPQQSGLNKQCPGVTATQRSTTGIPYGTDEITIMVNAGIDVICNPIPRGNMFGARTGQNASSNGAINGDNWPRLTSFLARSLAGPGALGPFIGENITPEFFTDGYDMLDAFLAGLWDSGTIGNSAGTVPYSIAFSADNNPVMQTAQGVVVATILIQFLGIARIFMVNMQTGQTVVIAANNNTAASAAAAA